VKIGYLHGYASYYSEENIKVKSLSKLGDVVGLDINYNNGNSVIEYASEWAIEQQLDLIVGCSMGAWLASHVGAALGVPSVMLNPALSPSVSLRKYLNVPEGEFDYGGYPMESIDPNVLSSYLDINKEGFGLVLLESADNVFWYEHSKSKLDKYYEVIVIPGGSHRFESLDDQLDHISKHVGLSEIIYGVDP
jgi:predicted esterase YcpF (UPF0227 family)